MSSMLYFESDKTRFDNESNNNNNRRTNSQSLPSTDSMASMFSSIKSDYKPKRPSNLVKTQSSTSTSTSSSTLTDPTQLAELVTQSESRLTEASRNYDKHFEQFVDLTRRFHTEKLNNLMLAFKNQILKQQIYFETELFELCKECHAEFASNKSKQQQQSGSGGKKKSFMRFYQQEMKSLVEYMRESLVNSSDTLIDAYESCRVLRSLHHVENSFSKQNACLKASTQALLLLDKKKKTNNSNDLTNDDTSDTSNNRVKNYKLTVLNEDEEEVNDRDDRDEDEEEYSKQIEKFQLEVDELMHTLDDIELQHLQRKELLYSQTKSLDKLRSKFKFIESKYVSLSKRVAGLKHESYLYKRLWYEKKRDCSTTSRQQNQQVNNTTSDTTTTNKTTVASASSSSIISPSNSSRTSSTCSMSDCDEHDEEEEDILSNTESEATTADPNTTPNESECPIGSTNSSDEANTSTSSIQYEHNSFNDNQTSPDSSVSSDNDDSTSSSSSSHSNNSQTCNTSVKRRHHQTTFLSVKDYNRKMALIHELIRFHKTRSSSSSSMCNNGFNSATNSSKISSSKSRVIQETMLIGHHHNDQMWTSSLSSSLDLSECSMEGDQVSVENCNLRQDRDISNWMLTRHVESMPTVSEYRFPMGSVINAGKVLRIDAPFEHSDLLDLLLAVGKKRAEREDNADHQKQQRQVTTSSSSSLNNVKVRIKTRLIAPDGSIKAVHTQETPHFYEEIFKYANLIHIF